MLRAFELVLVAEQGQRDAILARWPFVRGRVFLLTHWTDRTDVLDPYRQPEEVHERSLEQIEAAVRSWASRLGAT
jgi:protein-tyrosine phosphatase